MMEIGFASIISLTGLRVGDGACVSGLSGKDSMVIGSVSLIVGHSLLTMGGSGGGVLPTDLVSISSGS